MEWFTENWQTLAAVPAAVLAVASLITKLTKSPKDDQVVAKITAWLSFLQPKGMGGLKFPVSPPKKEEPSQNTSPFRNLRD